MLRARPPGKRCSSGFLPRSLLALVLALAAPPATAQARPQTGFHPHQLIVLLDHGPGAPSPEAVVAAHGRGEALPPAGLGLGSPERVEHAIRHRARGAERDTAELDPESPFARSQRYLLLTYPKVVDVESLAEALRRVPGILHVEKNLIFELSASPSDPFFPLAGGPTDHQWGSHYMNLPAAWDYATGHAYVGLIDLGIDIDHPDLRVFDASGSYVGGNFRSHFSFDFRDNDACVDERNACPGFTPGAGGAGHGTHVSGIVAATTDNQTGVAGACWNCSLLMTRMSPFAFLDQVANSLNWLVRHGAGVVSMSWGHAGEACAGAAGDLGLFCNELAFAELRDVVMTASPGNDKLDIEFPASDSRVISVGGIEPTGAFWDRADEGEGCPCDWTSPPGACSLPSTPATFECGSNYTVTPGSAMQDLTAPAKHVLSTFYEGVSYSPAFDCSDEVFGPVDGYGPCTGTSMSSPYAAGIAGILRSVNPLLSKAEVRDILVSTADRAGSWHPRFGYGVPDAAAAVEAALGEAGSVLPNRLTPLFQLYSSVTRDHVYTTFPQMGAAFTRGGDDYREKGPDVPGYTYFPGGNCLFVPCPATASVYVFSGDRSPNGHPLVPLYRLSFRGTFPGGPTNPSNADHTYTTEAAGVEAFTSYELDGIEGYIYEQCSPEPSCMPPGTVRLYRLYNYDRDDWAVFPETELAQWQADNYRTVPGWNPWIGYVYLNVDSDGDWVIDGFEGLAGTDPTLADSDGDGLSDGEEILRYPYTDPLQGTSQPIGELGQVSLNHLSKTVPLSRSYTNPVVLAQPLSFNGGQPAVVRILDVRPDRFTVRIEEPPNMDGPHAAEVVGWMVLESGSWRLADGTELEVGAVTTNRTVGRNVAGSLETVAFSDPFATPPLVLTQVQTSSDPAWVKTRQLLPTNTSLRVALEEEEASTTAHAAEDIGWLAITPGSGFWSGHRYLAASTGDVVNHAFTAVGFGGGFSQAPKLLAALASRDGGDNSALRYTGLSATGVSIKVEEDTTFDSEVAHTSETVHLLAIQGTGTLSASPR